MEVYDIKEFIKGWFIGDFEPSLFKTDQFEIAVKHYKSSDHEKCHVHRVATEYSVIIQGAVKMNDKVYCKDSIIVMKPGESTDFTALVDTTTVCVKIPCVKGDKHDSNIAPREPDGQGS